MEESYPVISSNYFRHYEFVSEGPKGSVRKIVSYDDIDENMFNLGFGDLIDGKVEVNTVTDNRDTKKVLLTVGLTLFEFFKVYPDATVYISGGNNSRRRPFRMTIASNLHALTKHFNVAGQVGSLWYAFEKNRGYDRFMIQRKHTLSL